MATKRITEVTKTSAFNKASDSIFVEQGGQLKRIPASVVIPEVPEGSGGSGGTKLYRHTFVISGAVYTGVKDEVSDNPTTVTFSFLTSKSEEIDRDTIFANGYLGPQGSKRFFGTMSGTIRIANTDIPVTDSAVLVAIDKVDFILASDPFYELVLLEYEEAGTHLKYKMKPNQTNESYEIIEL